MTEYGMVLMRPHRGGLLLGIDMDALVGKSVLGDECWPEVMTRILKMKRPTGVELIYKQMGGRRYIQHYVLQCIFDEVNGIVQQLDIKWQPSVKWTVMECDGSVDMQLHSPPYAH
jgi:hypothetical protein